MDVKEFFRITKEKIIISLFLVLYFYFSNSFFEISIHLHQIIARDIIGLATWNVYKMNTSFVLLLKIVYGVINWLFNDSYSEDMLRAELQEAFNENKKIFKTPSSWD